LKNILLVMADGGYLVPPSQDPSKEEVWIETRKRLGRFLPDLFNEVFPEASQEAVKSRPGSVIASPVQPTEVEKKSEETAASQETGEENETADAEGQPASEEVREGTS
jgi:brefeldin A-resistance guanine nucleotide exchange factor 1